MVQTFSSLFYTFSKLLFSDFFSLFPLTECMYARGVKGTLSLSTCSLRISTARVSLLIQKPGNVIRRYHQRVEVSRRRQNNDDEGMKTYPTVQKFPFRPRFFVPGKVVVCRRRRHRGPRGRRRRQQLQQRTSFCSFELISFLVLRRRREKERNERRILLSFSFFLRLENSPFKSAAARRCR